MHGPRGARAGPAGSQKGGAVRLRDGRRFSFTPRRPRGARRLVEHNGVDIVLADDGLQHYALARDGEIAVFKKGIDKVLAERPVPVVPMALCNLWGSMFSRRDPLHKRRPYKLWARIELRIGPMIPADQASSETVEAAVRALRGDDR